MDTKSAIIEECRQLLSTITPLQQDCGLICGGACCHSLEGETTGMLLFPGEEAYYQDDSAYQLRHTTSGTLLLCSGICQRENRPLSCRLFPLLPLLRNGSIKVAIDLRACAVCPLCASGVRGLRADMIQAVRTCGQVLISDPVQRQFLAQLTMQQDDLRSLMNVFGGR